MINIVSWGGGTQSSTLLLMAAEGLIQPMPDAAIFADVGDEPDDVYAYVEYVRAMDLPFPIKVVRRASGSISNMLRNLARAKREGVSLYGRRGNPPLYVREPDGSEPGILARQCTGNWKIEPIQGWCRQMAIERWGEDAVAEATREKRPIVTQWIGISTDEAQRMKPSRVPWITLRYPLTMEHRMSRADCLAWLEKRGYRHPPRSACTFCPYHSDAEWRRLRDEQPHHWREVVELEREIRAGLDGMTATREVFFHRARVPLDQVNLDTAEDRGQMDWVNGCVEGVCGV